MPVEYVLHVDVAERVSKVRSSRVADPYFPRKNGANCGHNKSSAAFIYMPIMYMRCVQIQLYGDQFLCLTPARLLLVNPQYQILSISLRTLAILGNLDFWPTQARHTKKPRKRAH